MDAAPRLVITADDLGIDEPTNAAIVDLLTDGLVTATTLMTVAPAADDAVARLAAAGLGPPRLHVTLTSARELAPWPPLAPGVPTLTADDGGLHHSAALVERRADRAEVVREMEAQLRWMHERGLRPTAMDSHSGTLYGMHGRSFAEEAVRFAAAHDLALRIPRRLHPAMALALGARFRRAHGEAVALADAAGVRLPASMVSCWLPGVAIVRYAQLRASVLNQVRALPAGTSELIVHPAAHEEDSPLARVEARKRRWELRLLRDPEFREAVEAAGVEVVDAW